MGTAGQLGTGAGEELEQGPPRCRGFSLRPQAFSSLGTWMLVRSSQGGGGGAPSSRLGAVLGKEEACFSCLLKWRVPLPLGKAEY